MRLRIRTSGRRLFRGIHVVTLVAGTLLLAWPAFVLVRSSFVQWEGSREIDRALAASKESAREHPTGAMAARAKIQHNVPRGTVLAKFEIPRLQISLVVLEGTDLPTLDKSIGHVDDTAMPGEFGNIAIAGHRNTHFKKLEWIRKGDEILLETPQDQYRYHVESVRLVSPDNVEVLDESLGPAVTLITCFPFEYVGHAPERFVVRAVPDEQTRGKLVRAQGTSGGA
jgi:sortase A